MSCSVEGGSPPFMAAIAAAPPGMAPRPAAAAAPLGAPAPAVAPAAGAAPRPAAGGAPTAAGAPAPNPPNPPAAPAVCRLGNPRPPNIITTGTGPFASAGTTSVIWISTLIAGKDELSTWPVSALPITGRPATVSFTVLVTVHVTLGTLFGTRPNTSRSKSSTISGRRWLVHWAAVVTFLPFLRVRTSGRLG